jgi:uncharacterized protein (DUF2164 family)
MKLELSKQETDEVIYSLKRYFDSELESELSDLKARLLFDYILKEFGPLAYNRGVQDAEQFMRARVEDIPATCFEQPMTYWKSKGK